MIHVDWGIWIIDKPCLEEGEDRNYRHHGSVSHILQVKEGVSGKKVAKVFVVWGDGKKRMNQAIREYETYVLRRPDYTKTIEQEN